jgi:hypothetical protein
MSVINSILFWEKRITILVSLMLQYFSWGIEFFGLCYQVTLGN